VGADYSAEVFTEPEFSSSVSEKYYADEGFEPASFTWLTKIRSPYKFLLKNK
jgi:hypothetical protein